MITILLADDHTIVRKGFRSLLEREEDLRIVAEACDGREAVDLALKLKPAVVLMDIMMPILNGLQAALQIRLMAPDCRILLLSMYTSKDHVDQVAQVGVAGYLLKECAPNDLVAAIREVASGKKYFTPSMSKQIQDLRGRYNPERRMALTPREYEVLQHVAEGKTNKEISAGLYISIKTVEKHRQRLMDKLGIHDVAGLTRYAVSKGIVEVERGGQG
jgi:DNA-binding NarL/FixJ family response regulator